MPLPLPKFACDLPAPEGAPDGVYSLAEGQYRLEIRGGRVLWTCYVSGGDLEDYLAGCQGVTARPMTPDEVRRTVVTVLRAEALAGQVARALGGS